MDIYSKRSVELRRRFYMLLQHGWRQMTQLEKIRIGEEKARVYRFICPMGWDSNSDGSVEYLRLMEQEEIARDRVRVEKNGGLWVELI